MLRAQRGRCSCWALYAQGTCRGLFWPSSALGRGVARLRRPEEARAAPRTTARVLSSGGATSYGREGAHLANLEIGQIRPPRRPSEPCSFAAKCPYAFLDAHELTAMVVGTPWPGGYVPGSLGAGMFAPALWEAACEGAWKPMHALHLYVSMNRLLV